MAMWRAMCLPVFWVMGCILVSGLAWRAGVGNPDLARMAVEDQGKPWHVRRPGRLRLDKAAREQQRAAVLRLQGDHAGAAAWSRRAAASFLATAEQWADTPVTPDVLVAAATAAGAGGDPDAAIATLLAMAPPTDHGTALVRQYRLGLLASDAKRDDLARASLSAVANADPATVAGVGFDALLDRVADNRREAEMIARIRAVCGTDLPPGEMIRDARRRLGMPAEQIPDLGVPALPPPDDALPEPASTLVIERLD